MGLVVENQSMHTPFLCLYVADAAGTGIYNNGATIDTTDCGEGIFFFATGINLTGTDFEISFKLQESSDNSIWVDIASDDTRLIGTYDDLELTTDTSEDTTTKLASLGIISTLRYVRFVSFSNDVTNGQVMGYCIKSNDISPTITS